MKWKIIHDDDVCHTVDEDNCVICTISNSKVDECGKIIQRAPEMYQLLTDYVNAYGSNRNIGKAAFFDKFERLLSLIKD